MSVKESPGGGRFKQSEGDWTCSDPSCGNVNFARRSECNKCGASKTTTPSIIKKDGTLVKKGGHEIGKQMAEKSKGLFSADDWQCKSCGNVNWARRMTCNVCNAPKYGKLEQRTGYGGGFMERDEVVEYKEKIENDDDGDYDEFGRLRKDKRGKLPIVKSLKEISPVPDPNDEEEEEDDEDGDVSKYQLESDDDEDADLSKYALSDDSDNDSKSKTEPKSSNNTKKSSRSKSRSRSRSSSSSSSSSSSRSRSSSSRRRRRSYSRSRSRSKSRDRHHKRRRSSSNSRSRSRSPKRRLSDSNRSRH